MLSKLLEKRGTSLFLDDAETKITTGCKIYACTLCGIKLPEQNAWNYTKQELYSLPQGFSLNEVETAQYNHAMEVEIVLPTNENNGTGTYQLHHLRSIYRSIREEGKLYKIHPELVIVEENCQEYVMICPLCVKDMKSHELPVMSVAAGVDFGDYRRIDLVLPNMLELMIISRMRMFHSIVKIQPNSGRNTRRNYTGYKLRTHVTLFRHDTPSVVPFSLLLQGANTQMTLGQLLEKTIQLEFVRPRKKMDHLTQLAYNTTTITARTYVVYQWYTVLQHMNPLYKNDPTLPPYPHLKESIQFINEWLFQHAMRLCDEKSLEFEQRLGDDTTQRSTTSQPRNVHDSFNANSNVPQSYDFVHSIQNKCAPEIGHRESALLRGLADTFDIPTLCEQLENNENMHCQRMDNPASMYDDNNAVLAGSFPHIFMFGKTYCERLKKPLNQKQRLHLLCQFTNLPASTRELCFLLYSQHICHANAVSVHQRISENQTCLKIWLTRL